MTKNAKAFLMPACLGFAVALVLAILSRYAHMDMQAWTFYVWPTVFVLGGISGVATLTQEAMAIGISAFLNAMAYGIVGWFCYQVWRLVSGKFGT